MSLNGEMIATEPALPAAAGETRMLRSKKSTISLAAAAVLIVLLSGCSHRGEYQLSPASSSASGAQAAWVVDTTNGLVSLCEGSSVNLKCSPQADPQLARLLLQTPKN